MARTATCPAAISPTIRTALKIAPSRWSSRDRADRAARWAVLCVLHRRASFNARGAMRYCQVVTPSLGALFQSQFYAEVAARQLAGDLG